MISRVTGVGKGQRIYPATLKINGQEVRKLSPQEVLKKGLTCTEATYIYPDGEVVDPLDVLTTLNPETDPIILERRARLAKEDPINTSL